MYIKRKLITLLLLILGAVMQLSAQTAVTVGSQVTSEASLQEGVPYLIYQPRNNTYVKEASDRYSAIGNNSPDDTGVFYFVKVSDGVYKIKSYSTGKFISKPTTTGISAIAPVDETSAGEWNLQFDTYGCIYPLCNGYGWDRGSNALWATSGASTTHDESGNVKLYKIYEIALSTTALSEFADKDISISSSEAASISAGQWYVMKNRGRNGYAFENSGSMKNQGLAPSGSAVDNAKFLVRFLNVGDGKYYLQNGYGNYWGVIPQNTAVPATALGTEKYTIGKISSTDGHFYLTSETNGIVLDCQENGYPVVGWGTSIPTSTGGNNDWAFYPVDLVESWDPAINEVYTINNTNTNRGALIYNPDASTKYVWSSGKSGTFDASNANSQWVIIPSGTDKQFYLYNVGAGKFAIPTNIAQGSNYSWVFSDNAVAVIFETQNDGTKKIKMATNPVSGTNAAYMAISNNYTGPVINYNDAGGNFTITLVDGQDQSAAANAAVDKLVKSQTPLTTYPSTSGWYAIQIKSKTGSASYAGRFLQNSTTLFNNLYPLTFTGGVDVQPAITDPTFITYINCTSWDVNTWQLPDGRYLVSNSSSKFPTTSTTAGNVICGYDNGNYFKSSANYYADPYNSNANYFIGETTYMRTAYTVYPIDLNAAGLAAWKVVCDNAPESSKITCSRNDVRGLSAVYKNGYFFLPADVTPLATDFALEGASEITIDETDKTISITYDPNLALVEGSVHVEQGWQTVGRDNEVMLLRVTASPFKAATNVSMKVNLKDGAEANISELKLYEASSDSPEIYSTGSGAPTKTEISTASISGSTATFNIGDLSEGTHYYWIGATASSNATIGAILDAAVTDIVYTCNDNVTDLDLTNVGDPADRGAMVFNVHSYPFLPRDNGSRVYRIPAMIVAEDGSIVVAADKRYQSHTDIGNGGHVIDIVVRRSTDGGKTWSAPVTIAKGEGSTASGGDDKRCGFGDPSLVKGKDGKLYCLFAAGNEGYFYGQKGMCMSVSTDNGVTWSSGVGNPPVDLYWSGAIKNVATAGAAGFGLYDYFVTSGRGLYIPDDDILMYLIPAQTMTSATEHTGDSQDYIFYSRDGGESWYFSNIPMVQGGDEAKIIQMNDGSLFGSIRKGGQRRFNTATYTCNDDGKTLNFNFGTQWDNSQLTQSSQNNQDILYYQRETVTGKKDYIFHSITTGNHTNFKLYYSTDQGNNWTEFLNVQTKGTRYVTMDKSGTDENPGSLYLFFEDQSLNSAGGYTDYNHYPLNFIEITREQLLQYIPDLDKSALEKEVKIVYGTSGEATFGSWSDLTWTSNAASGVAGLTMTLSDGTYNRFSNFNSRYNLAYHPAAANTNSTITLTAPAGYVITGYSVQTGVYQASTYTLTAEDGTSVIPANLGSTYTPLEVSGLSAASTAITVTTTDASKWLSLANFTVTIQPIITLDETEDMASTISANDGKIVNVTLNRKITEGFNTVVLPFDLNAEQVQTLFGTDAKVYAFSENSDDPEDVTVSFNTVAEGTIAANQPVLVDATQASTSNSIMGVTVAYDAEPLATGRNVDFVGLYAPTTVPENDYFIAQGAIYKSKGETSIKSFRAYLKTKTGVAGIKLYIDDVEDGIQTLSDANENGVNIYNVAGQRMSKTQKGINIVNGKKVIVK